MKLKDGIHKIGIGGRIKLIHNDPNNKLLIAKAYKEAKRGETIVIVINK